MRSTRTWLVVALLAAGTLAGCCRRCPPCPPTTAASHGVPGDWRIPEATRQAVVQRLRVGMTIDEVRATLRPFADPEAPGLGGLGGHGWITFGLRDGSILLHFWHAGGSTTFRDGPGDGTFTDKVPPFITMETDHVFRLVAGGDFNPAESR